MAPAKKKTPPAKRTKTRPAQSKRIAAPRVVIVGGGIMGTSCALVLARRGAVVTVLEKSLPGAEASSAAAGILGAQAETTEKGPVSDLCQASLALYPAWVSELEKATGIGVEYRSGGTLKVAYDAAGVSALFGKFRFQKPLLPVERLGARALRDAEPA